MTQRTRHKVGRFAASAMSKAVPKGLFAARMLQLAAYGTEPARQSHGKVYGRIGDLEVRLARTRSDVRRAQRLRYEVFYEEMSAEPSITAQMRRRDEDRLRRRLRSPARGRYRAPCTAHGGLDAVAGRPHVVGTYRVLRQEVAERTPASTRRASTTSRR